MIHKSKFTYLEIHTLSKIEHPHLSHLYEANKINQIQSTLHIHIFTCVVFKADSNSKCVHMESRPFSHSGLTAQSPPFYRCCDGRSFLLARQVSSQISWWGVRIVCIRFGYWHRNKCFETWIALNANLFILGSLLCPVGIICI